MIQSDLSTPNILGDGILYQVYYQFDMGTNPETETAVWDVASCAASFPGYDFINETQFLVKDAKVDKDGQNVSDSIRGYTVLFASTVPDDDQTDWTADGS